GVGPAVVEPAGAIDNHFVGLVEPREGSRNHPYAPPTIPHREFLRQDCATCHDKRHPNEAMRVAHSDRINCMQCHVPEDGAEFEWNHQP
ncbi:MAG: hypothetical protein ACYTF0_09580, partial [Planctomycetota bacterium]